MIGLLNIRINVKRKVRITNKLTLLTMIGGRIFILRLNVSADA